MIGMIIIGIIKITIIIIILKNKENKIIIKINNKKRRFFSVGTHRLSNHPSALHRSGRTSVVYVLHNHYACMFVFSTCCMHTTMYMFHIHQGCMRKTMHM